MKKNSDVEGEKGFQNNQLRGTLEKIIELANTAIIGNNEDFELSEGKNGYDEAVQASQKVKTGCVIKQLPKRLLIKAAETARAINPLNAPVVGSLRALGDGFQVANPLSLAVLTSKYWGSKPRTLTVSFMESTPTDLRTRIISHMNAWTQTACISFVETSGTGDVRISREPGGYWSYLGTDILHIPKGEQTMNLEGFTMNTQESEYRRVVRHETGHTLGFPHEHMRKELVARIDPQKAYDWFLETYGWDKATVDAQVLTPLDNSTILGTPADQTSIMCYQLPALITKDGKPIIGGIDINQTDYDFAGKIYPKKKQGNVAHVGEWAETEDVEVTV